MNTKKANKKERTITIRLSDSDYKKISRKSDKEGMAISEFVRESALNTSRTVKGLEKKLTRIQVDVQEQLNSIYRQISTEAEENADIVIALKKGEKKLWDN